MTIADRVYQKAKGLAARNGNGVYSADGVALESSRAKLEPNVGDLRIVTLSDVTTEDVEWMWPGRIAFGKLSVLEGDPGVGKSTLTIAIAAFVTGGGVALPDATPVDPADVLFVTYEDGLRDTVRPRLVAAGGDPRRFHVVDSVFPDSPDERPVTIPNDHAYLRAALEWYRARLLVIDPLGAALSSDVDAYKDSNVRRALAPLSRLADELGVAVIVVRHFPKQAGGRAITAGAGSIGISGAARSVLALHQDPGDPSKRVLAVAKCNLARLAPSLRFRLEPDRDGAPRILWDGESSLSADALTIDRSQAILGDQRTDEACEFLLRTLAGGPRLKSELIEEAAAESIPAPRLEKAKRSMGVRHFRKEFKGPYFWEIPRSKAATKSVLSDHIAHDVHASHGAHSEESDKHTQHDEHVEHVGA